MYPVAVLLDCNSSAAEDADCVVVYILVEYYTKSYHVCCSPLNRGVYAFK